MKIGVRVHDFGKSTPEILAKQAKEMGFDCVQLVLNKAIEGETGEAGTLSIEKAEKIKQAFENEGLEIAMLGAYFNPVHSDINKTEKAILKFKEHLKYAKYFNTSLVGTETGSYNDDKWTWNEKNLTEEAFQKVLETVKDLCKTAEENGSYVAIEGAYGHCMTTPIRLRRLYDEVNSPNMKIIVDIYNYLSIDNHREHCGIFDLALKEFKDQIVLFHLKDYVVEDDKLKQVGLGQGMLNLPYILSQIKEKCPNAYCIFEGVKPEDMASSLEFVKKYLK